MGAVRSAVLASAVATGVLLAVAGCADADLKAATASAESAAATGCQPSPRTTPAPRLPAQVAGLVPEGAVVTTVEVRSGQRTVVGAVVARPFEDALSQLRSATERAGLSLENGEVEEHDAESDFHGHGVRGRWALRAAPGCEGSTLLSLVVAPGS